MFQIAGEGYYLACTECRPTTKRSLAFIVSPVYLDDSRELLSTIRQQHIDHFHNACSG